MIAPSLPAVPCVDVLLALGDRVVDLARRVLVAGEVPVPRFGREGEAIAAAAAVAAGGADLVDVSLPPRLIGPVARASRVPVVARAGSVDRAVAAASAGVALVLVPAAAAPQVSAEIEGRPGLRTAWAVVVADLADLAPARALAERRGVALAFDATRWLRADGMARESAAIAEGCRLVVTSDVRRSRRVAEVIGALLAARRDDGRPAVEAGGGGR